MLRETETESTMFKPKLIATAVATAALFGFSGAFAQEATPAPEIDNFKPVKTRAAVIAETQDAIRQGAIARNEADVQRLAAEGFQPLKSRAQVRAETMAAIRMGLVNHGEAGAPQATPEQLEQIRVAGLRALERGPQLAGK